jgi:uncharacterized protein YutE (UPF0331/DUF86 family)
MRLDLYQAETARIASEQSALLDEARQRLLNHQPLSPLEQNGVLHALQVLIENAIGKAKQRIKARNESVPVAAYDAFGALARLGIIEPAQLDAWAPIIGLRNRIVHDYMNLDMRIVLSLVERAEYAFVVDFLRTPQ